MQSIRSIRTFNPNSSDLSDSIRINPLYPIQSELFRKIRFHRIDQIDRIHSGCKFGLILIDPIDNFWSIRINPNVCSQSDQLEFSIRIHPIYPIQYELFRKIRFHRIDQIDRIHSGCKFGLILIGPSDNFWP